MIYAFFNGFRDSSSILASVIASRAMNPRLALYLGAVADLIAPFLFGTAVARSVTTGLVKTSSVTLETIVIAMVAALGWSLFSWWKGIPSSGLILAASAFGMPVSTPHVISTALLGAGAAERVNKVSWQVAGHMVTTWVVTIPATMLVSASLFMAMAALHGLWGNFQGFLIH